MKSTAERRVINGIPEISWRFDTPLGSIERIRVWEPGSYSWAIKKWGVRDEKDLAVLAYAMSSARYTPLAKNYDAWADYVGDNGVQCRNMARPGSRFCGLHERMDGVEVSDDPDSLI